MMFGHSFSKGYGLSHIKISPRGCEGFIRIVSSLEGQAFLRRRRRRLPSASPIPVRVIGSGTAFARISQLPEPMLVALVLNTPTPALRLFGSKAPVEFPATQALSRIGNGPVPIFWKGPGKPAAG